MRRLLIGLILLLIVPYGLNARRFTKPVAINRFNNILVVCLVVEDDGSCNKMMVRYDSYFYFSGPMNSAPSLKIELKNGDCFDLEGTVFKEKILPPRIEEEVILSDETTTMFDEMSHAFSYAYFDIDETLLRELSMVKTIRVTCSGGVFKLRCLNRKNLKSLLTTYLELKNAA